MINPASVTQFLAEVVPPINEMNTAASLAYWQATTTGKEEYEQEFSRLKEAIMRFLADPARFAAVKWLRADSSEFDPLDRRQLDLYYLAALRNQVSSERISELVRRETELDSLFTNFRSELHGKQVSDNELRRVLKEETDNALRKQAWEASKQIAVAAAPKIIALVELRNRVARELGFPDFYHMSLELDEQNVSELFETLDQLEEETREPFRLAKAQLDTDLAARFGVSGALAPWHYADPFFQDAPRTTALNLDSVFGGKDAVALARDYYSHIGLDVTDILAHSDLYERPGKYQHAYCTDIDRAGDVRVLCNMRDDAYWAQTILHELGHGVYFKYIDPELPYILREPAHISATEAVAIWMGRLTTEPEWLARFAGAAPADLAELAPAVARQQQLVALIFIRWALVVVNFERALYANPQQDLNTLWWDLVERLQMVPKPKGRSNPDWAAKIHIATVPAYYQNYILGELIASQLSDAADQALGEHGSTLHRELGAWLKDRVFSPGACRHWQEWLQEATGERLNPQHWTRQFVR